MLMQSIEMAKYFYIFRHGQSTYNLQGRTQGRTDDSVLTELGKEQAKAIGQRLAGKGIEIIACSPLKRARQTAQLANEALNVPIVIEHDFNEIDVGLAEGLSRAEIKEKFPEIFDAWHTTDRKFENVCYPGGETKKQARERIFAGLQKWAGLDYQNIAVSAHGIMLAQTLIALGYEASYVENGSILVLEYDGKNWKPIGCASAAEAGSGSANAHGDQAAPGGITSL